MGVQASFLDDKVFNQDASFIKKAPFISTLIKNPNHIRCQTVGHSESFSRGKQAIEKELIEICAVDILKGKPNEQNEYVTPRGTEANLQAIWIYRNHFITAGIATKSGLVPDNHSNPLWCKIIVMKYLTIEKMMILIDDIKGQNPSETKIYSSQYLVPNRSLLLNNESVIYNYTSHF